MSGPVEGQTVLGPEKARTLDINYIETHRAYEVYQSYEHKLIEVVDGGEASGEVGLQGLGVYNIAM